MHNLPPLTRYNISLTKVEITSPLASLTPHLGTRHFCDNRHDNASELHAIWHDAGSLPMRKPQKFNGKFTAYFHFTEV